jgi:hypothetical protein
MASITLAGTLLDPNSDLSVGDEIRFTHASTTGQTIKGAVSLVSIGPNGTYSVPLQYGLVLVEYKDISSSQFKNLGMATVNGDNPATTIPELLNALVPVSSAELIEFQAILADAVTAKNSAEAALAAIPTYGTAATADVTTNVLDTTAGRITKVGDYGVGTSHLNSAGNFNDVTLSGLYSFTSGATGEPISSAINTTLVMKTGHSTIGTELNIRGNPIGGNDIRAHIRGYDTSDPTQNTSWAELWHSENLNYLQNTSGSTSASNATVGGSSLTPTQTGTWRNVSGGDILDNGYGLWSKV